MGNYYLQVTFRFCKEVFRKTEAAYAEPLAAALTVKISRFILIFDLWLKKSVSTFFKCTSCGYTQPRRMGRCPECEEWNTFRECIAEESPYPSPFGSHGLQTRERIKPLPLSTINPAEGGCLLRESANSTVC